MRVLAILLALVLAGCTAPADSSHSSHASTSPPTTGVPIGPTPVGPSVTRFDDSGQLVTGVWGCETLVAQTCKAEPDAAFGIAFDTPVQGHVQNGTVVLEWTAADPHNANLNLAVQRVNATARTFLGADVQGPSPLTFTVPPSMFQSGDVLRVDVYGPYQAAGPEVVAVSTQQPFTIHGALTVHGT